MSKLDLLHRTQQEENQDDNGEFLQPVIMGNAVILSCLADPFHDRRQWAGTLCREHSSVSVIGTVGRTLCTLMVNPSGVSLCSRDEKTKHFHLFSILLNEIRTKCYTLELIILLYTIITTAEAISFKLNYN